MPGPLRIGIIGCGRILPAHLRGYRFLREAGYDDFRITALVARREEDAYTFRKRGEGPTPRPPVGSDPGDPLSGPHLYVSDFQPEEEAQVYPTVEAMLAAGVTDAVDITATLPVHHTAGLAALAAGQHAMIQKPLALTVRAGRALVEAAEGRGLALGVMENVRYAAANRIARWAIERGDIGALQMIAAVGIGSASWSPDRIVAETPWRHRRMEAGGGASLDIGVHLAHRLRYLAGEVRTMTALARTFEPERIRRDESGAVVERVAADADDAFFALPQFASGAVGSVSFTWAGHGEPTGLPEGIALYGSRGCIKGGAIVGDDGAREELSARFAREADTATRERFFPRGITDTFALAYLDWFAAIRAGTQPEMSGAEGLRDLATAYAILESSALGGAPVAIDAVLLGEIDAYQRPIDQHWGL